jgi:hypothetical protein
MTAGASGQRSQVDDLDGYASPKAGVSGQFEKLEKQNAGKPQLDRQEEYVFELQDRRLLKQVPGFKKEEKVDKVLLIWKEIESGNLVQNSFRIDNPVWNDRQPDFQSPVLSFFDNIGASLPKDPEAVKRPGFWGPKFILTMKIRARVTPGKDDKGDVVPGKYKLELATVRQYRKN